VGRPRGATGRGSTGAPRVAPAGAGGARPSGAALTRAGAKEKGNPVALACDGRERNPHDTEGRL
jgi:hypothetical protein